jgi:protein involved in polysaccharide export with SLBB domain
MRIRTFGAIAVAVVAATVAAYAADQGGKVNDKPQWRTMKTATGEVVIFGDVKRPGFFATPKDGMSLKQLVSAAGGVEKPDGAVVHLRRHAGKDEARFIEVKADALDKDGDIDLEPNDIVHVTAPAAAKG